MKSKDAALNNRLTVGIQRFSEMSSSRDFIEPSSIPAILKDESRLHSIAEQRSHKILYSMGLVDKKLKDNIQAYLGMYDSFPGDVAKHNNDLARGYAVEVGSKINPVEGHYLDIQQLSSIAMDVRTRLVLAGAGTGKTTTIVGFIKCLLASGKANPEEILALSFTNASVDELKKRIRAETGHIVETTTFHRLGIKIIASSDGKVPKISNLDLYRFISDEIRRRQSDKQFMRLMNDYLIYDFDCQRDESSFGSSSDYILYLKENPLFTLNGEKVKSFGEADIANFLAINGIPYEYEKSYEVDTNDSEYGQYRPDFHLTGTNIYIEYFGIDRNGSVAPFMIDRDPNASDEYRRGIEWKKDIHRTNRTRLIEIYAYNRSEGDLAEILEKRLRGMNIRFVPTPPEMVFMNMLERDRWRFSSVVSSFVTILTLIKGTGKPWNEAYPDASGCMGIGRSKRLESILRPLYEAYQKELSEKDEIDFEDMLNRASQCIWDGKYHHPYKYVIVDEYQDISRSRFRLLRSMRRDRDYRLYCVGDDWQSIYRFNGSDISYILDFEKYWGPSAICRVETTYRFGGELLRLSSEFICRNRRQYRKDMVGLGPDCSVNPILASDDSQMRHMIAEVLEQFPTNSSVLFLGRYNHDVCILEGERYSWKPDIGEKTSKISYFSREDLDMRFMTIHGSKGLQADYVISLNNKMGRYGFPGNRDESPVIGLLMNSGDSQYDEERRLFYVAMTRARKGLYIASYVGRESAYYREVFNIGSINDDRSYCPICGGQLVLREGKFGNFMGCENYRSFGCRFTRRL